MIAKNPIDSFKTIYGKTPIILDHPTSFFDKFFYLEDTLMGDLKTLTGIDQAKYQTLIHPEFDDTRRYTDYYAYIDEWITNNQPKIPDITNKCDQVIIEDIIVNPNIPGKLNGIMQNHRKMYPSINLTIPQNTLGEIVDFVKSLDTRFKIVRCL